MIAGATFDEPSRMSNVLMMSGAKRESNKDDKGTVKSGRDRGTKGGKGCIYFISTESFGRWPGV